MLNAFQNVIRIPTIIDRIGYRVQSDDKMLSFGVIGLMIKLCPDRF